MADDIDLGKLEAQAASLVKAAIAAGADSCDVVVSRGRSLGVEVRNGRIENTSRSEADDFSLRVFVGRSHASVGSNSPANAAELAARAVAMAKVSPEDPYQGLAPKDGLAAILPDLDLFDATAATPAALKERALACEAAGLEIRGVAKSMGASAGWGVSGFVLATSDGFTGNYLGSRHSVSAAMVAGEGEAMERDYDFHSAVHLADLRDAAAIGRSAGERVVARLSPRRVASAALPVLFDRRSAAGLLGALLGAINGAAVARKTSFLRDRLGKAVAHPAITVFDDPLRRRGLASRPFDGEGMATAPFAFVDNGVLKDWVLDWASARELGLRSNGHAGRGGSGTTPSTSNCHVRPGAQSPAEMIASLKRGVLVTETIGHGVNMVTGDFSKGAAGFWIEDGAIAWPISEFTVAGNLKDMFLRMTPADDLEFRGATNSPSLLVEGMTVGGR
jgi:PmbA protein